MDRSARPARRQAAPAEHWFHIEWAAFKRPEPLLETLVARAGPLEGSERLEAEARLGTAHNRLTRINGAERAATGRAQCRSCREPIAKDCARGCFETAESLPRLRRFLPGAHRRRTE